MDRFPIPQFISRLPHVTIPSPNVLREKALYRDPQCSFTDKDYVFCDRHTRVSVENFDASVLVCLNWLNKFAVDNAPQISES
jgi:hypothetical protein